MAENERLREALLELEALRDRESRLLAEGNVALRLLSDLGQVENPRDGLRAVIKHACNLVGADWGTVVTDYKPNVKLPLSGQILPPPPVDVFAKQRNLVDIQGDVGWAPLVKSAPHDMRSVLCFPLGVNPDQPTALLLFGQTRAQFSSDTVVSLRRMMQLCHGALQSVELRNNQALLAAVIAGSSTGFAIADAMRKDDPLIFVNDAFEQLTGYTSAEVLGTNCRFMNDEPNDSPELARLRHAIATRTAGQFLLRNKRKSGHRFWNDLTLFPVAAPDGTVTHLVATQTDVSERVQAQMDRDATRQSMDDALAHTKDSFLLLDSDRLVQFANDATRTLFDAPHCQWAVGTRFKDNWDQYLDGLPENMRSDDPEFLEPDLGQLAARNSGVEIRLPDNRVMLVRANQTNSGGMVISASDVTALKNAERQTRQRTAAIESAQDGIGIADRQGRMIYANSSLARLLGADTPDDVVGQLWHDGYQDKPDSNFMEACNTRGTATGMFVTKAGQPPRFHEVSLTCAKRVGVVLIVRDVTDRIAEQERQTALNQALEQARQREILSGMAGGIAHDFNNILSVINGSAVLLGTEPDLPANLTPHVDRITKAGTSAAKLVNHMLDLANPKSEGGAFDLKWAVDEVMVLASASVSRNITVSHHVAKANYPAYGRSNDPVQVLMNLIINASDAMAGKPGRITVQLDMAPDLPAKFAIGTPDANAVYGRLSVQDTGSGIPPQVLTHIFDAHFSTKGEQGSGVGLSTAATMVDRIGGGITVETGVGQGTRFDVYWPLAMDDLPDANDDATPPPVCLRGKMILVLDDDQAVTDVLQDYLERMGAEVAVCHAPEIAIECVAEAPGAWDVVITDYDMPGLTGGDVVDQIRAITPNLPIFVVTALAKRLNDHRITPDTVSAVLAKPLNLSKLASGLAKALKLELEV